VAAARERGRDTRAAARPLRLGTPALSLSLPHSLPPPKHKQPPHKHPNLPTNTPTPETGHCKRLAPVWEELAAALKAEIPADGADGADGGADAPAVRVAHVDCTTDKSVCAAQEVKGYPTLKIVHKGEIVEGYKGSRDLDALKAFAVETHRKLTSEV
jgi:thiol-disulfide isomerase/thioredoxin